MYRKCENVISALNKQLEIVIRTLYLRMFEVYSDFDWDLLISHCLRAKLSVVAAVILKMSNLRIIICLGGKHAGGMSQGDRVTKLPKNICECDI